MLEISLYVLGMALLFAELFVPGGIMGLVGVGLVGYALAVTWIEGQHALAIPMTLATVIALPLMLSFALKRLSLRSELRNAEGYEAAEAGLDELVGREGVALTALRPSGTALLGERRVSVVAESGLIDPDTPVRVVRVEGNRVVVRAA